MTNAGPSLNAASDEEPKETGLPALAEDEDIFEQRKQITRGVPTGAKHAARSRFEPTMSYRKA